jgi:hypothetical protein
LGSRSASLQFQTEALLFDLEHGEIVLFHQIDDRFDFFDVFGIQGQLLVKAEAF